MNALRDDPRWRDGNSWRDDPQTAEPQAQAHASRRTAADVSRALMLSWQASLDAPPCPRTGIRPLDDMMPGLLLPGRMTVIGARPAVGKTALSMQIAEHIGGEGDTDVILVSLEMTAEALARRHVVARSIARGRPLRDPHLWRDQVDAEEIANGIVDWGRRPYLIIDQDRRRAAVQAAILDAVRDVRERGRRVGAVIVDYLQQITDDRAATREREVGAASVMLAETAKREGIAMLVLAQLNRGSAGTEPRPPVVTDLRDSGQIEQDADAVLLLHRQAVQQAAAPMGPREVQIIIGKARHWGVEPGTAIEMEDRGLCWVPVAAPPVSAPARVRPGVVAGLTAAVAAFEQGVLDRLDQQDAAGAGGSGNHVDF